MSSAPPLPGTHVRLLTTIVVATESALLSSIFNTRDFLERSSNRIRRVLSTILCTVFYVGSHIDPQWNSRWGPESELVARFWSGDGIREDESTKIGTTNSVQTSSVDQKPVVKPKVSTSVDHAFESSWSGFPRPVTSSSPRTEPEEEDEVESNNTGSDRHSYFKSAKDLPPLITSFPPRPPMNPRTKRRLQQHRIFHMWLKIRTKNAAEKGATIPAQPPAIESQAVTEESSSEGIAPEIRTAKEPTQKPDFEPVQSKSSIEAAHVADSEPVAEEPTQSESKPALVVDTSLKDPVETPEESPETSASAAPPRKRDKLKKVFRNSTDNLEA